MSASPVVRPPLRERLLVRLASIELNPRELIARVPFVALVIAALGFFVQGDAAFAMSGRLAATAVA